MDAIFALGLFPQAKNTFLLTTALYLQRTSFVTRIF